MSKRDGAFLTIGELSSELGVPHHILRYWESRFPMLRPLQRAGNRRYYRPEDVELARRIHHLLNAEGYTVRGAQQALAGMGDSAAPDGATSEAEAPQPTRTRRSQKPALTETRSSAGDVGADLATLDRDAEGRRLLIERLQAIRARLEACAE